MGRGNHGGGIIEGGQGGLVQMQLDRAEPPWTAGRSGERQFPGQPAVLLQLSVVLLRSKMCSNRSIVARRHVGNPGDAVAGKLGGNSREIWRTAGKRAAQPLVLVEQASGKAASIALQPGRRRSAGEQCGQRRRVEQPHSAGAMLQAQRPVWHQPVERCGIGQAHHALMIADTAQPASSGLGIEPRSQPIGVGYIGRAAPQRCAAGSKPGEVDVMIMQAGEQSAAAGLDVVLARLSRRNRRDLCDPPLRNPHIGEPGAPDFGIAD